MLEELQDRFNKPCTVVWMKENCYWALSEFSLGGQCRMYTFYRDINHKVWCYLQRFFGTVKFLL